MCLLILRLINGKAPDQTELYFGKQRLIYFNHHDCHAASAFFNSPFISSDILTIDAERKKLVIWVMEMEKFLINFGLLIILIQ